MADDPRLFVYQIDQWDRIGFANQEWFDFARENQAMALEPGAVIGSSLWDHIADDETRHLFRIVLRKVRDTGKPVVLPFRCDSADRRRFMEMKIIPMSNRNIGFSSRILRQEPREGVRLLETEAARTDEFLVMCGWCKKVFLPENRWAEVEEAVRVLQLFDAPRLPMISHAICNDCSSSFAREVGISE